LFAVHNDRHPLALAAVRASYAENKFHHKYDRNGTNALAPPKTRKPVVVDSTQQRRIPLAGTAARYSVFHCLFSLLPSDKAAVTTGSGRFRQLQRSAMPAWNGTRRLISSSIEAINDRT
jgi:hypothetical protein